MKSFRCRAFTLIELLAVVSIGLLLLSLLFPMIRHIYEAGRSAGCIANMRKAGIAFQSYAAENDGLFPAPRWRATDASAGWGKNPSGGGWLVEVSPYFDHAVTQVGQLKVSQDMFLFCPTYMMQYKRTPSLQASPSFGIGMNPNLGPDWNNRYKASYIKQPMRSVLLGDSDGYFLDSGSWATPDQNGIYTGGDPVRHEDKANYLYADGHAAKMNQKAAEIALAGP